MDQSVHYKGTIYKGRLTTEVHGEESFSDAHSRSVGKETPCLYGTHEFITRARQVRGRLLTFAGFLRRGVFSPWPSSGLEVHPLWPVRNYLFNKFGAQLPSIS
jgi:hypothetical protein